MFIVVKHINIFTEQINGIVDTNGNAIINFLPVINCNHLYAIDKLFYQFKEALESWWQYPHNDIRYKHKKYILKFNIPSHNLKNLNM